MPYLLSNKSSPYTSLGISASFLAYKLGSSWCCLMWLSSNFYCSCKIAMLSPVAECFPHTASKRSFPLILSHRIQNLNKRTFPTFLLLGLSMNPKNRWFWIYCTTGLVHTVLGVMKSYSINSNCAKAETIIEGLPTDRTFQNNLFLSTVKRIWAMDEGIHKQLAWLV